MCTVTLESTHFIFNMRPIYTHDGASVQFSTNSQKTDYSVLVRTWRVGGEDRVPAMTQPSTIFGKHSYHCIPLVLMRSRKSSHPFPWTGLPRRISYTVQILGKFHMYINVLKNLSYSPQYKYADLMHGATLLHNGGY
jgi:hypothetical protein